MLKKLLPLCCWLAAGLLPAQTLWIDVADKNITPVGERRIVPARYRTVHMNPVALQALLQAAPGADNAAARPDGQGPVLNLPLPEGGSIRFRLVETPVMAPALQAKYPDIRTYTGYGLDDPGDRLKCDWTPRGFHAMIHSLRHGTLFIDPYSQGDREHYVVYNKKNYLPPANKTPFHCGVETPSLNLGTELPPPAAAARSNDGQLRRYRLALACTGEYSDFHGGTKPLVMAAMVTSMNRVNQVYEREFAVTMQMVPNNDTLIFLNASSDPYNNGDGGAMLGQNRTTCNTRIGSPNYDIGHVFSTGGGGVAFLGCVCTSDKARGVTGQEAPIGDPFDIDYVAHEMGHQFGGNHTQNNPCNRNDDTAMEPGSASTIMGYAGICAPDVQPHSDDYFHGVNMEEIVNFILNGDGNTCPVFTPTGNGAPQVTAGPDYTIPRSTFFVLTAQGSDPDPDSTNRLTYCWEQMDPEAGTMPPAIAATKGPMFRSFNPDTLPVRYFPRLTDLVKNINPTWERIPSAGRKLKFRVTVRDNHPAGGQTDWDDMVVTVSATSGPFRIAEPNTKVNWRPGEYRIVTWSVANTNKAPVNCQRVNIRLSTDGGFTYPELLAAEVPNTGSWCVRVPDLPTGKARVKVESVGNIFFDISNVDFNIVPDTVPSFSLCMRELSAQICLPNTYTTTVSTSSLLGFDSLVTLVAEGLPTGVDATFSPNPVLPGNDAQLTLNFASDIPEGPVNLSVAGIVGTDTLRVKAVLTVVSNNFDQLVLQTPANGTSAVVQSPVLHWQKVTDADTYEVEVSLSPAFDVLVASKQGITADSFKVSSLLEKGKVYFWRVRPVNPCGPGPWVGPFAFATVFDVCSSRESNDVPKNISASLVGMVESKIDIADGGTISDVNIKRIQIQHEFFKDLEMHLISPTGTDVLLFKDKCGGLNGVFSFGFDDSQAALLQCPPGNSGTIFKPEALLDAFKNENVTGLWTLQVKDNAVSSGGSLSAFILELCSSTLLSPPVLVNNNPLVIDLGKNKVIGTDLLKTTDANNSDAQLLYTLVSKPRHGQLQLNFGGELLVGAQFTQADLNSGLLYYFHTGTTVDPDDFCFTVTDGEGGLVYGCFSIQPFVTGTSEASPALDFRLWPNPATEQVRIALGQSVSSQTRIRVLDTAGRLLREVLLENGQSNALLDVRGFPRGVYSVTVENAEGSGVKKLVVN